jgi:hypothetical protein
MSAVSPQHANSKRTDDASTLAKDLLGVTLVPETMVQSAPDVTSSPPVDQEVPINSRLVPFGFSLDPPRDFASVDAFIEASPNPPGYGMRSPWDRTTAVSTYGPSGSEEDDEPDFCWDFSGLGSPSAMRDFMTACDYCLSDCSDGSRSFGDEDGGPSRECFHADLGGPGEGNHLGIPENGDPPRPAPRVDILRELAVVPVPTEGQDSQLEQIHEMKDRLDEGAGTLEPFCRDIGQEWAGQPPAGEARHLPQGIQHRIADDVKARPPLTSSGVGQNLAAAAILLRAMPEPSTTEWRRIQGELKNLLEDAAVRRAESSASRRQGYPRNITPRLPDSCGKPRSTPGARATQRLRPRVASATSTITATAEPTSTRRCAEAITPGVGDATTVGRIGVPHPNHPVHRLSAGPYDGRRSRPGSEPRLLSQSTRGRRDRNCGSRTTGWPATWVERTMTTSSSATSPCSSPTPLEPGWSTCLRGRSPTGTIWSKPSPATSRARTCALGTPGISEAAASSRESLSGTTSGDSRSSAPSCPTSPTRMSSARSLPAPPVATW